MGKATGFLEYKRTENEGIAPLERIKNFEEFHRYNDDDVRMQQAARCMDCGVPLCQSAMRLKGMVVGCPLHNLIPEWNDAVYEGHNSHALLRLLKTNPFPEFTGRVCPALCEKTCMNGLNDEPVTIRDNELYIIEEAYKKDRITPIIPEVRSGRKVAVIGSGPSGLAAAHVLNRRGHLVTVYERDDHIGGLLMYGIPNMKLDKSVIDRRQRLMEEEGITFVTGADVGRSVDGRELMDKYDALVLCCGAKRPRALNAVGMEGVTGIRYAVEFLSEVTHELVNGGISTRLTKQVNNKNVIVIGGGDTGNDCIGTVIRMGAKSVTALEMMPKPPIDRTPDNPWPEWPKTLRTDYGHEEAVALYGRDPRVFETTVKEVISDKGRIKAVRTVKVTFKNGKLQEIDGSEETLKCDLLLIAAGFTGAEDYLPSALGVELSERGTVKTSSPDEFRTGTEKIFTAGDMHRGQSLVVWAIAEGKACAAKVDEYLMGYSNL